jgi:hypothetical protein
MKPIRKFAVRTEKDSYSVQIFQPGHRFYEGIVEDVSRHRPPRLVSMPLSVKPAMRDEWHMFADCMAVINTQSGKVVSVREIPLATGAYVTLELRKPNSVQRSAAHA